MSRWSGTASNAALGVPPHPIADFPEDDFDVIMRVNLKGLFYRIIAGTPLGRAAAPEEIAESPSWLLSDRSSYLTGVVLPVTGGIAV